ncbi:heavy metal-associated isoprenylated plant protein 41-like isoform X1 [Neltuma alba]|uniref:heavy metal-associated isoprenylated plant protein 41-like isoform X1 n=3 Tax=Neltuma alba TaxID=207710 RepID=UPI0010A47D9F|nr:heavy metal-associated isoprenylated plant protein 41-like isoform X1 [Prosopis alba]
MGSISLKTWGAGEAMALQMSCQNKRQKLVDWSDDGGEKWVKYYSSHHQILLVGEGDFSFSLSLAQSFGSGFNIVASSLDTYDQVVRKYKKATSNLIALTKMRACVLHGVDATQMKFHPYLEMRRFDRIIFNFPHAGFHGKEDNFSMIQKHKDLVRGFFMNAGSMLRSKGEIHINHKTKPPFDAWCIKELGIQSFLWPIECVEFKKEDYPGYNNKRGDGSRSDEPFYLGKCSTFKFALLTKNESYPTNQRTLSNHHYPLISLNPHSPPSAISCRNGHLPILEGGGGYLNGGVEILGRVGYVGGTSCDLQRSLRSESTVFGHPQIDYVMNMDMILGKQVSGYVHGFSSDLQISSWPKSTEFSYPTTGHVRNMDMMGGRFVSEYVHGISSDLQRRSWPKSSNVLRL